jgi:hypothetical protein
VNDRTAGARKRVAPKSGEARREACPAARRPAPRRRGGRGFIRSICPRIDCPPPMSIAIPQSSGERARIRRRVAPRSRAGVGPGRRSGASDEEPARGFRPQAHLCVVGRDCRYPARASRTPRAALRGASRDLQGETVREGVARRRGRSAPGDERHRNRSPQRTRCSCPGNMSSS